MAQNNYNQFNFNNDTPYYHQPGVPPNTTQWRPRLQGQNREESKGPNNVLGNHFPFPQDDFRQDSGGLPSQSALVDLDPLSRFYQDDGPWNPERTLGPVASSHTLPSHSFLSGYRQNLGFMPFPSAPSSDRGSTDFGPSAAPSDSGYGTIKSGDPPEYVHECPEFVGSVDNPNFSAPTVKFSQSKADKTQHSVQSQVTSVSRRKGALEKCPYCDVIPRCASDLKKHKLKHEKPFHCDVPGCTRALGFTTKNDLDRHKKSLHKIGSSTKSYRCAFEHCRNRDKIWPRLDNFKQHVQRMHPGEDVTALIRQSEYRGKLKESSSPRPSAEARLEATLAGMDDTSKYLTFRPVDSSSSHSLILEPDTPSWKDLDRVSEVESVRLERKPSTRCTLRSSSQSADIYFRDDRMASGYDEHIFVPDSPAASTSEVYQPEKPFALSTLAAVATSTPSMSRSNIKVTEESVEHRLSGKVGPLVHSQQDQKKALGHLSTLIADGISRRSLGESLDKTVFRVLNTAAGLNTNQVLTFIPNQVNENNLVGLSESSPGLCDPENKEDLLSKDNNRTPPTKLVQQLAYLPGQAKKPKTKVTNASVPSISEGKQCARCSKVLSRNCDMRKHMKRHTRPYGCTFPGCLKSFGSKNDWKRHENSQHFQLEMWRCNNTVSQNGHVCAETFSRKEMFEDHLKVVHHMDDAQKIAAEVSARRIGRNGQGRFWCGFCKDIIKLQSRRNLAWDERFNHIDNHFKEGLDVKNWLCLEAKKTKGEVAKNMDRSYFDDDDILTEDYIDDPLNDRESSSSTYDSISLSTGPSHTSNLHTPVVDNGNQRKRQVAGEQQPGNRHARKRETICDLGPWSSKLYSSCAMCSHEFCSQCSNKTVKSTAADPLDFGMFAHGE